MNKRRITADCFLVFPAPEDLNTEPNFTDSLSLTVYDVACKISNDYNQSRNRLINSELSVTFSHQNQFISFYRNTYIIGKLGTSTLFFGTARLTREVVKPPRYLSRVTLEMLIPYGVIPLDHMNEQQGNLLRYLAKQGNFTY